MALGRTVVLMAILALLAVACGSSEDSSGSVASSGVWSSRAGTAETVVVDVDPTVMETPWLARDGPIWIVPWKGGFLVAYPVSEETPFPELTDEQEARLPEKVVALFEGDPPGTVEEAISRVLEADLGDLMNDFFPENPDLYSLIMEGPPDPLGVWTSADGLTWNLVGKLQPPAESFSWQPQSDGEWLVTPTDTGFFATSDLTTWEQLPIVWGTDSPGLPPVIAVGTGGWVAVVQEGRSSTALIAEWGEEPVEVQLPGQLEPGGLVKTPTGAVAVTFDLKEGQELYAIDPLTGTATLQAFPSRGMHSMWPVEGGVMILHQDAAYLSIDDGANWTKVEIAGFPMESLRHLGWFPQPQTGSGFAALPFIGSGESDAYGPGLVMAATHDGAEWLIHETAEVPSSVAWSSAVVAYDRVVVWTEVGGMVFEF